MSENTPEVDPEVQRIIDAHPPCTTAENGTGARCTCDHACANYRLRARGYKDLASRSEASYYGDGHRASLFYDGAPGMLSESDPPVARARSTDLQAMIVLSAIGWTVLAVISVLLVLVFGPVMVYVTLGCASLAALLFLAALVNALIN